MVRVLAFENCYNFSVSDLIVADTASMLRAKVTFIFSHPNSDKVYSIIVGFAIGSGLDWQTPFAITFVGAPRRLIREAPERNTHTDWHTGFPAGCTLPSVGCSFYPGTQWAHPSNFRSSHAAHPSCWLASRTPASLHLLYC